MKGIIIGRHINGITLNPLEYILNEDGNPMMFETEDMAKDFLRECGFDDEDMYYLVFKAVDNEYDEEKEFYKDLLMEQQEQM